MLPQQTSLSTNRRSSHKLSTSVHWVFRQNDSKLLKITQNPKGIVVSLLRNAGQGEEQVTVWRLPFKLNNFKTYALMVRLSPEELSCTELMQTLADPRVFQVNKFDKLITHRIEQLAIMLGGQDANKLAQYTGTTTPLVKNKCYSEKFNCQSVNFFILDVLQFNASSLYPVVH